MKFLITAFTPFNGDKINPSQELIKRLPDAINGSEILTAIIPTEFSTSIEALSSLITKIEPDCVICLGQAGNRLGITVERVAINIDDSPIKDNAGNQPIDKKIFENGKNAYFSTLPIKSMVKNIKDSGIPASISNTAGTFVCNHLFYGLMHKIESEQLNILGGFIHIPFSPIQCIDRPNSASMSLTDMYTALESVISTILENKRDIKETGGSIS